MRQTAAGPWIALLLCIVASVAGAEDGRVAPCPEALQGIWSTDLPVADLFRVEVTVGKLSGEEGEVTLTGGGAPETVPVWRSGDRVRFHSGLRPLAFDGRLDQEGAISGFVSAGSSLMHVRLPGDGEPPRRSWSATWNLLGVPGDSFPLDLYVGTDGGATAGWFFFRDPRLPSLFGYGTACAGDAVRFGEKNLDLVFEGRFERSEDSLVLTVRGAGGEWPLVFRRLEADPLDESSPRDPGKASYREHAPPELDDGWPTAAPSSVGIDPEPIADLVEAVRAGELPSTHAVLVARRGRLAVEEYFYGFDRDTLHDMRSASKTVAGILVGLAIGEGYLPSEEARVLDFFPSYRRLDNWDARKRLITVRHLLTMSSGLDADDSNSRSVAAEHAYQSQTARPDWLRLALDAPMIGDPGAELRYGSANPMLVGGVLERAAGEPVERFAHRTLFAPLGISAYRLNLDPTGAVYLGGGMHMRPRDMAKLGQLHLGGGLWQGHRILSADWVRRSTAEHGRLANVRDKNGYGYLWWRHSYRVGERTIDSIEARGNGGQYIFVVPELEVVAVITSGNYRNRELLHQPEAILRRYILPAAR